MKNLENRINDMQIKATEELKILSGGFESKLKSNHQAVKIFVLHLSSTK